MNFSDTEIIGITHSGEYVYKFIKPVEHRKFEEIVYVNEYKDEEINIYNLITDGHESLEDAKSIKSINKIRISKWKLIAKEIIE